MRLRRHREDVADLKLMCDNYVQEIARRYMNLIRMAEETLGPYERTATYSDKRLKVVKDAE